MFCRAFGTRTSFHNGEERAAFKRVWARPVLGFARLEADGICVGQLKKF